MFSRLFSKLGPNAERRQPEVPSGAVVWAIGDIHGRLDLLDPLLEHILEDLAAGDLRSQTFADEGATSRKVIIFLGDYVDRGPDSRGVLDRLVDMAARTDVEARFLRGNHEEQMLAFLDDPAAGPAWCDYGGKQALESYGLQVPAMKHVPQAWVHLAADLNHVMPRSHRSLLEDMEDSLAIGDYFFAHAGARPGVPLDQQKVRDLLWIRDVFLNDTRPFEKIVVHGHTPARDIYRDDRRIGVDTGVYKWNVLSAVRLEGSDVRFAQSLIVGGEDIVVRRRELPAEDAA